jgi:hypothetical protein
MAADILQAIITKIPIEHEPKHDIESFIYVLAYSVTRRAVLELRHWMRILARNFIHFLIPHLGRWMPTTFGSRGKDQYHSQFALVSLVLCLQANG